MEYYSKDEFNKNQDILLRAAKGLEDYKHFEEKNEIIMAIFLLLLDHPLVKKRVYLLLSSEITKEIEGNLIDRICTVINKTYLMKVENATLNDDRALEIIRDYILEQDEFVFYKNEKRILRRPNPKKGAYRRKK